LNNNLVQSDELAESSIIPNRPQIPDTFLGINTKDKKNVLFINQIKIVFNTSERFDLWDFSLFLLRTWSFGLKRVSGAHLKTADKRLKKIKSATNRFQIS